MVIKVKMTMKHKIAFIIVALACTNIAFAQNKNTKSVDEKIITTPYGDQTSLRMVGDVEVITQSELLHTNNYYLRDALIGKVAGLLISKSSQNPENHSGSMTIRGNSRGLDNGPLIIIDGIANRSLTNVTVEEVEKVLVLKDATAKMLYGSKAANGVIVVMTKRGHQGETHITASGEYGVKTPMNLPDYLGSYDYARLYNQARLNDGLSPAYSEEQIQGYKEGKNLTLYPNVDFYDYFLKKNTSFYRGSIQIDGGQKKTNYFLNLGYIGENGLESVGRDRKFNRLNFRSNLDYQLNDVISVNLDISGVFDITDSANMTSEEFYKALSTHKPNDYPLFVTQDGRVDLDSLGWGTKQSTNLYGELTRKGYEKDYNFNTQTNLGLKINLNKFIKGLKAEAYVSFDVNNTLSKGKQLSYSRLRPDDMTRVGVDNVKGSESKYSDGFYRNVGIVGKLEYNRIFKQHAITAGLFANRTTYSPKTTLEGPYTLQDDKSLNYGISINYAYNDKYVAQFTSSLMGSDKFIKDNRWGLFTSGGAAWIISKENFMRNYTFINYLKLKASYGLMGYDESFDYLLYEDQYTGNGSFKSGPHNSNIEWGYKLSQLGNPNLTFEKSRELNIALSGKMFNNHFNFDVAYFREHRFNIPVTLNNIIPDYVGGPKPVGNYNAVNNNGFEVTLGYENNDHEFKYAANANLTYSKAMWDQFDELVEYASQKKTGRVTDAIMGLRSDGLFKNQAEIDACGYTSSFGTIIPGDIKYINIVNDKKDNVIDKYDMVQLGHSSPRFYYSLNINMSYKAFSLYLLGQGVADCQKMMVSSYLTPSGDSKYSKFVLNAADPANVGNASYPRLTSLASSNSYQGSDFWLKNAGYFKLRTIELKYRLPKKIAHKIYTKGASVYLRGDDLFTISGIDDVNIEDINSSITNGPIYTTVSLGLKLTF